MALLNYLANQTSEEQDRIKRLRDVRAYREHHLAWKWSSNRDEEDIFDLRYLFENEEILEAKRELIEDEEMQEAFEQNPYYFRYMLYDNDENAQQDEDEEEEEEREYVPPPPENWDDARYNMRFDMRLGFNPQYGIEMSDSEEGFEGQNPEFARAWVW